MTLEQFFQENKEVAIAFSGGVDSAYLLYAAKRWAKKVCAYYVKSAFQPQFEFEDAKRLAEQLGAEMRVLTPDILACSEVTENPKNRCYFCKRVIFEGIRKAAAEDGFTVLLDGTNASDDAADRPGMRALTELSVRSPLRECGLTKTMIRTLSKEAGLFTWDKPAYACLATRIPSGEVITAEKLTAVEASEGALFSLGFTDFRVRSIGKTAKLQVRKDEVDKLLEKREEVVSELKKYYDTIVLDLETMR